MSAQEDQSASLSEILTWLGEELAHLRTLSQSLENAIAEAGSDTIDPVQLQGLDLMTQTAENLAKCAAHLADASGKTTVDAKALFQTLTLGQLKDRLASQTGLEIPASDDPSHAQGHVDLF